MCIDDGNCKIIFIVRLEKLTIIENLQSKQRSICTQFISQFPVTNIKFLIMMDIVVSLYRTIYILQLERLAITFHLFILFLIFLVSPSPIFPSFLIPLKSLSRPGLQILHFMHPEVRKCKMISDSIAVKSRIPKCFWTG